MYTIIKNKINNNKIRYQITKQDSNKLTYAEFINLLKNKDEGFLTTFKSGLTRIASELDHTAYLWKCVPVSKNTLNKEFEFVAIKSESLENVAHNYYPFQEHFNRSSGSDVVSFPSLSGITLVSPVPVWGHQYSCTDYDDELRNYKNLREFNCEASKEQWNSLWQKVGVKMEENLTNARGATRWLSTSGLGIPYLHVRIDSRPKYYNHQEYLRETQEHYEVSPKVPNRW